MRRREELTEQLVPCNENFEKARSHKPCFAMRCKNQTSISTETLPYGAQI